MPIATLVQTKRNFMRITETIAAILANETASQQAMAVTEAVDPELYRINVYSERSDPWADFQDAPASAPPIVCVRFASKTNDKGKSNVVERQLASGTYHIDCYGYGVSADDPDGGHDPGDARASLEAQRAVTLVEEFLMAGIYTYLGQTRPSASQYVWGRWESDVQMFQPAEGDRPVQNVWGARVTLIVDFNEFSQQVPSVVLEEIAATVKRQGDGRVQLIAQYGESPP